MSAEESMTNGSGAAAILAAGVGAAALGVLAVVGDTSAVVKSAMIFYKPTGPLSGVTTVAILVWVGCWGLLEWRWRKRSVALGKVCVIAWVLLGVGVLLTCPLVGDLF
jgi:hypothetical protein